MRPLSYAGYRFPPEIIQNAIWLYLRFTLNFRDVEELLAERGIDVSHETIRRWVAVFGPMIARRLRAMRPKPHTTWHLDEMFVSIGGKRMYLWRAVDGEGSGQNLIFRTNLDEIVTAGPEHPLRVETAADGTPAPYILVRPGLEARLARPVFYEVVDLGEEVADNEETRLGVWSGGTFFDLGSLDELESE